MKKTKTRPPTKKPKATAAAARMGEVYEDTNPEKRQEDDEEPLLPPRNRKLPKRAAARSSVKEKPTKLSRKASVLEPKKEAEAGEELIEADEEAAVARTAHGVDDFPPCRKLADFALRDADGHLQSLEMSRNRELSITGTILPSNNGGGSEARVRCESFGPIKSLAISGYDEQSPAIWVETATARYECVKPEKGYKKYFDHFWKKAKACAEVYKVSVKSGDGNFGLALDELVAGVVRGLIGSKCFPDASTARDFVFANGEFVFAELTKLDEASKNRDISFASMAALIALKEECVQRREYCKMPSMASNGSLKIDEQRSRESEECDDEKIARLLQEEENWHLMRQRRTRQQDTSKNKYYIKMSEAEIANDYPMPAYYNPSVQEMDEYIFFESELDVGDPNKLPRRLLHDWALYNSESRLVSLELLPMKPCAENDVTIFGSGKMTEDDGSGFCFEGDQCQSSSSVTTSEDADGIPIYLSALKEWMIEFGSSIIFISIRTHVGWYRLGKPAKLYAAWYEPVVRTARLAINIITLLKEQSRVSRLSFSDVIKKISEFAKDHASYISSDIGVVERYVVVHGQIILHQFSEYPDKIIQRCAFITGLLKKMEERRHTKLELRKKVAVRKEGNQNPNAGIQPVSSKRNLMRATMTKLINRIWSNYYSTYSLEDSREENQPELEENEGLEEELEENDEDVEENILTEEGNLLQLPSSMKICKAKSSDKDIRWEEESTGNMVSGEALYGSALVQGDVINVGGAVIVEADESKGVPVLVLVEYMFEKRNGLKMVHGRVMKRGSQTLLGNAADDREVFLTNECMEFELGNVKESVILDVRSRPWGHEYRKQQANADMVDRTMAEEKKKKGLPVEFYCKSLYWPEKGAFCTLPYEKLGLGTGYCSSCRIRETNRESLRINSSKTSFIYKNTEYIVGDYLYIRPQYFGEVKEDQGTFKGGRNVGLKAYVVCHLMEIEVPRETKDITPESSKVKVRRFYRPEDVSAEKAYCSDIREIYYSEETLRVPVEMIEGKCEVRKKKDLPKLDLPIVISHIFFCEYSYDAVKGAIHSLPHNVKLGSHTGKANGTDSRNKKEKGKCIEGEEGKLHQLNGVSQECRLDTLDIFAGCGGLSEGLQQSGVSFTKWAIEYEQAAGEAFCLNHSKAQMFIDNCNVILRAIMEKCGDADDCISTPEASELAMALDLQKLNNLPIPGEVDFINGGPPCQGFSGMNRFNQGTWSKVQCEMILAFLSFADYFRPRFFLLENVRNFVSFNKGQTFRLTIASLLEMGYQVRFGILEAGAYGVSQSRKRAFIWAASPTETLPEWPEPMHVFAGPELKISLPGGIEYAAVKSTAGGAPYRSITVRDTIGDLPSVENGASKPTIDYQNDPVSWFQKQIRGSLMVLNDHISKEMNELNLIRCQHIPKCPGADWRSLPDEKVKLSNGQMVDLIPWCLPNTAKRHNQWKGLFGRLDWEGNFPTSVTDPQPMGKVGMCFHPEQDRIVTVRECARSQGFPDSYRFSGSIQNKHRQIGNAVPPPLAYALGRKLKEAVDAKHSLH